MGKIIVSFSHKGGVGKTTLVQNIGVALSKKNKKVLLIDFDPQRNLSANIAGFGDSIEYNSILKNDIEQSDDDIDRNFKEFEEKSSKWIEFESKYSSFLDILNDHKNKQVYNYIEYNKRTCPNTLFDFDNNTKTNLSLIRGDIDDINDIENMVQADKFIRYKDVKLSSSYKIQQKLIDFTKEYDFILIDTAPNSVSLLNGLLVQICDYFYTPFQPNLFSLQAIQGMDQVINQWNDSLKAIISTKDGLRDKAIYLGCIVNMTKKYNNKQDKVPQYNKEQKEKLNSALKKFLKNRFVEVLTGEQFCKYFENQEPYIINDVRHFTGKLGDIAEKNGISVYELTNEIVRRYSIDIENEENKNTYAPNFKDFKKTITEIADGFIKLP